MGEELNFVSRVGSVESVLDLTVGDNCSRVNQMTVYDHLINKVQVLGNGTGRDQVKSAIKEDTPSQTSYGIKEYTYTAKNIVDVDTADLLAQNLIDEFKNPYKVLTVNVVGYYLDANVGDNVTLTDSVLGISSEVFRIKSKSTSYGAGGSSVTLVLNEKQMSFEDMVQNLARIGTENATYDLGIVKPFIYKATVKATSGEPLQLRFTTDAEIASVDDIESVKLVVARLPMI